MAQITEHFTSEELERSTTADKHGIVNKIPTRLYGNAKRLCEMLERVRALPEVQRAVMVTSGYRSPKLNARVSSSRNSQHMYAQAADIYCKGLTNYELAKAIEEGIDDYDQLIYEGYTVHISVPEEGTPPRRMALTQVQHSDGRFKYHAGIHDWT